VLMEELMVHLTDGFRSMLIKTEAGPLQKMEKEISDQLLL